MRDVLPSLLTLTAANSHYTLNPSVAGINECNRELQHQQGLSKGPWLIWGPQKPTSAEATCSTGPASKSWFSGTSRMGTNQSLRKGLP